jgi:hypothetical protein
MQQSSELRKKEHMSEARHKIVAILMQLPVRCTVLVLKQPVNVITVRKLED